MPEGATAKAKNDKNGVASRSRRRTSVDALKTEIDGRITKAADWVKANVKAGDKGNQGGVGGGKADDGMNHSGEGDCKGKERKKAATAAAAAAAPAAAAARAPAAAAARAARSKRRAVVARARHFVAGRRARARRVHQVLRGQIVAQRLGDLRDR